MKSKFYTLSPISFSLFFFFLFYFSLSVNAQEWTWMKGSNTANELGVYGTQGMEDPANTPGARNGPNMWSAGGSLWVFGGYGTDADENSGSFNDLWQYNISTNNWTWMRGADTLNSIGSYGAPGVPDPANEPGPRIRSATWTDGDGNLWMHGGLLVSSGRYSDLWKYDVSTNEWTWIHGADVLDMTGSYGTMGTAAPDNAPGARHAAVYWKDQEGNFWMYGGFGFGVDPGTSGWLADLWKYDLSSGEWTWVNGIDTINAPVIYGEIGVPSPDAQPGGRGSSVGWTGPDGDLWLFGGIGTGRRNDLWKYDITTNEWTWVKGSNETVQSGTVNVDDPTMPLPEDTPGARNGQTGVTDLNGHLWLFGGWGNPAFEGEQGFLNDTWRYEVATDLWYYINGELALAGNTGTFGTQGTASPDNAPPSLASPASVLDEEGSIWLFGGNNSNARQNALWKLSGGILIVVDVENLDTQAENRIEVYPNPASNRLFVDLADDRQLGNNAQIRILDAHGRLLMQEQWVHRSQEVNVAGIPAGNYVLLVELDGTTYSKKIIKQ